MSGADSETVRREAGAWFEANWDAAMTVGAWWGLLAESGWGLPHWPSDWYGRGLGHAASAAVAEQRHRAGAYGPPGGISVTLVAPTLFDHGSDELKRRYLPDIVSGVDTWCQFFSEPGAGSDMAAIATSAERDGDEWVVDGQKVWTSGAHESNRAVLIARTDPDVPKHRGLTFFAVDMDQPGVEVRPLRDMTGDVDFNEVFLTDARVRNDDIIGDLNDGWRVAMTMLAYERDLDGVGHDGGGDVLGAAPLDTAVGEVMADRSTGHRSGFAYTTGSLKDEVVTDLVARFGGTDDPVLRQKLAGDRIIRRVLDWGPANGVPPSASKLLNSGLTRDLRDRGFGVAGAHGLLTGDDAPDGGHFAKMALFAQGMSIAGGTDEVQRNILGERVLGLPAEPRVDKDVPFRDLPRS